MNSITSITYITDDGEQTRGTVDQVGDLEGYELLAAPRATIASLAGIAGAWAQDEARVQRLVETMMPLDIVPLPVVEQARRNAELRTEVLRKTEMLDSAQVAEITGSRARNRSAAASRLARSGAALWVEQHGRRLFPAFQFDAESGEPLPVMRTLIPTLQERGVSGWSALLWILRPSGWLGGEQPFALLRSEPERVLAAARDIGRSGS